jgi:hypothetical protein
MLKAASARIKQEPAAFRAGRAGATFQLPPGFSNSIVPTNVIQTGVVPIRRRTY